jgi:hypothetical protein
MRYLKQNSAVRLTVGPFLDKTDGITPEVALTATNEKLTFMVDTADVPTIVIDANATGSGGNNDFVHVTGDDAGFYDLELTAAQTNYVGRAMLSINYVTDHCPVFHEFTILPANVYDSLMGTDLLQVDNAQWLGQTIAAVDTNGYPKVTVKSGAGAGEISTSSGGVSLTTSGVNAVADQVWDEAASGHVAAGSFGARLAIIRSATAAAGAGTTITLDGSASAVDDFYNNQAIFIVSGTGVGQGRIISDYVGSTKVATVSTWATNPSSDSVFVIVPFGSIPGASAPTAAEVADAVWDELLAGHTTEASYGALMQSGQLHVGTAQAGAASSITFDATGSSATNDLYNYQYVTIRSGTGAGQTRQITDYNGTTKVATTNLAWTTTPSTDSEYIVHPGGLDAATVAAVADAVWDELRSGHVAAGSFGEYVLADATRISGDATAADNLEAMVDGTGLTLTGVTVPTVTTVGTLTTYTGNTPQTGDAFARLGAPAGASVSADVAAVKSDSAAILVDTGTTLDAAVAAVKVDTAAILVDTGTTLDAAVSAVKVDTAAIKAKTDSLTFTAAGHVDANLKKIAGTTVLGDGAANPWGP